MSTYCPLVSIGLPVFNCGKTIRSSICSVLNQSYERWELLVVDDGSRDDTVSISQSFRDERIRVIADGQHLGLPAQLNRAVEMSRGRYFARMDGDDIAYPDRLLKQFEFLESHPEVDLVGAAAIAFRSDGTVVGARRPPTSHAQMCKNPAIGIPILHPTWMGRIEWFRAHLYRLDALLMEDRELLLRTHTHSNFANLPEVLLGYREDRLHLSKILLGRKHACRMLIRYARTESEYSRAFVGISTELAKACLETIAIGTRLKYRLLRHRARPLTEAELKGWQQVYSSLTESNIMQQGSSLPPALSGMKPGSSFPVALSK